ncbi:hypothetical protein ASD11_08965 [Aeromicrobium sp. Root495]|uniref:S1C family serine protease n=1 Tax=Aeromicrobium sp. Root495 TaxID=1736550 RepID=UPI0006FF7C59|nr:trypsin-like peptidase domain-containing protein [Aeromicrobium sp. Root495]KQY59663.1 hypothetical protein ASD11_08965 [Aeromicrobium sp. Root495]
MSSRHVIVRGLGTALAFALGAGGIAYATTGAGPAQQQTAVAVQGSPSQEEAALPTRPRGAWGSLDGGSSAGSGGTSIQSQATDATTEQEKGLVYLTSTVAGGTSAGTGMVLTADGEVVTNHHVVEGAGSITAEVVSTGEKYRATVVGYDATHDVAVLELTDASGLATVTTDPSGDVEVGDAVVGVGNANGDGGAASAAAGTVSALDRSISVSSESGQATEQLSDLIQVDADIISGDSGGALYDADGEVIGMNTAASSGTQDVTGYAIPIADALAVVEQVESGAGSGTVRVGSPGFLGVQLSGTGAGAVVADVVDGSAADGAGITSGSTITSLDGDRVSTADALASAVADHPAGAQVVVGWTDGSGASHQAGVTLGTGSAG